MRNPTPAPCCGSGTVPDLVACAVKGDRRASEALIGRYQLRVARFVMAATRDASQCEDLCQTIFVKMVLALPRLRAPENFEPWLFRIARNVCRDHLRKARGDRKLFVAYQPAHEALAAPVPEDGASRARRIEQTIANLPPDQRELILLSLEREHSYGEIAAVLHATVPAVKSRLWRARQALRSLLLSEDPE